MEMDNDFSCLFYIVKYSWAIVKVIAEIDLGLQPLPDSIQKAADCESGEMEVLPLR